MAYAAVISLKQTINRLVSPSSIREYAYNQTTSLQQALKRLNDSSSSRSRSSRERLDALDGKIRDCAHKLEDVLEFHELNSYEDEEVRQEITSFVQTVEKMEKDYIEELSRDDDDDDTVTVSSSTDSGVEMVGNSPLFTAIRDGLLQKMRPDDMCFFSVRGEIGSSRTVVVMTFFEYLRTRRKQFLDCCAWVTIGNKHQLKEVLIRIIAQVDNLAANDYELLISKEDEKLSKYLYKLLDRRRYMIVLDDVWDVQVVEYLRKSLPDQSNGSIVLLTTSLEEVSQSADKLETLELPASYIAEMFWYCLRLMIFGYELISPELEEAGRKIMDNCRGRPISAAKTMLFLLKTDKTVEQWSKIAADKENPIFMVADEISEVGKIKTEMQSYNLDMYDQGIIGRCLHIPGVLEVMKMTMYPERFFPKLRIISLEGMAGVGKTTLTRNIFKDKAILRHFDYHVWITLGPKYRTEEILVDILAQIYDKLHIKGDEKLVRELCVQLSCKRCLIVLDDLWSKEPLHHLKNLFPDIKGTILVTTRLAKVAKFGREDVDFEMQLLDEEESRCLFRQKVFAEGSCPPELEKAGRKIVEKCEGLPLLILTVADQLLKVEMSEEYWNSVASGKLKSVFMNAHHQISEGLLPSYQSLPQHLKPCFLYIGVFREKYEISTSKLTNLLIAEGFLETNWPQTVQDYIAECLTELRDINLVMVFHEVSDFQIKICRLHPVFWHLANSQAVKNKFFHAMNSYDDCSIESIKSQRRLCIRNSILLGMKDVRNSMASNTSAHSLLCVNPLQQYPVPLNFDMRLLRVMNALTIRLYEFPIEVVRLVHLRYLGLTCNGKLPTSISNLWKLQYLIVKRYMNIKSSKNSSPLPMEIWDMKELKHLEVMGGCLPDHKRGAGLLNLLALLDVSAQSCRLEVLKWIPNLKRLGIRIELEPDDEGNSFHYLNNIYYLCELESLKCVVVNPQIRGDEVVPPPAPISMFPPSLKKLSLSGLGYPWEYMCIIGNLENLEVLKLKCYAFQGAEWEIDHYSPFKKLKFLLVEDTNLGQWKVNSAIGMKLERLYIKHCYKLKELPKALNFYSFTKIEIVDCDTVTLSWAVQMQEIISESQIKAHISWMTDAHQ